MLSDDIKNAARQLEQTTAALNAQAEALSPFIRTMCAQLESFSDRARSLETALVPFDRRFLPENAAGNVVAIKRGAR